VKVAVSGKGGSGKTTIVGIVARVLAEQGRTVLAVDADTNPNLGISLGLGVDTTFGLIAARQALDETPPEEREHATTMEELIERFGAEGPDGIRLVQVSKVDHPNPG
jgi:CO dehydrogenase maturation factor